MFIKKLFPFVVSLFFFLIATSALMAQVQIKTVTVTNPAAISCSNTDLTITGEIGSTYPLDRIDVSVVGLNIVIDVIHDGGGIEIPTVTQFTHTVSLGILGAGSYTGIAHGLLDTPRKSSLPFMLMVAGGDH